MTERLVKCPFNPIHIMTESSLQRHIIRCMVNYPGYVACPYNAMHRFKDRDLLSEHMLECNTKEKLHLFFEPGDRKVEQTCFHMENARVFNLNDEDWDKD